MAPEITFRKGQEVRFFQLPKIIRSLPAGVVDRAEGSVVFVSFPGKSPDTDLTQLLSEEISMSWETQGQKQECPVMVREVGERGLVLNMRLEQQRAFLRVQARLTLVYEVLSPEQAQIVCNQVLSQTPSPDDLEIEVDRFWRAEDLGERIDEQFQQITRFLKQVDSKLDYLIGIAEGRQPAAPLVTRSVHLLDISGAGLAFLQDEPIDLGTYLKLSIQISRFPMSEVISVGRVVRCTRLDGQEASPRHEIGVQFECIHEDDREKVFRFISRVERKMLRERKEIMNS